MSRVEIWFASILAIIGATVTTSCSKGTTPGSTPQASTASQPSSQPVAQPLPQPAAAASQAAPPAAPANVIASGQYSADPDLRCDLLEVKRVSGGALLVKWRIVNTASGQATGSLTAAAQPKAINWDGHWVDLYYIDPVENKKYGFLTDAGGDRIADLSWGSIPAGQQRGNWAKFPAPPASSNKISLHIPSFPPFEDVPVS
jgi:hypothetical protein